MSSKEFGEVELATDEMKTGKVRIITFIDEDIYNELKSRATHEGTKYQTLLNSTLKRALQLYNFTAAEPAEGTSYVTLSEAHELQRRQLLDRKDLEDMIQDLRSEFVELKKSTP